MPDGFAALPPAPPPPLAASPGLLASPALRAALRRGLVLLFLALLWEGYGRFVGNELLFPTLGQTLAALWRCILSGELPDRAAASLGVLALGYGAGLAVAALLVGFAVASDFGSELLTTLTAMFNPLPAIALLPLALLWFGLGTPSLVFVIGHSVLWAAALNAHSGVRAISPTLRRVGENLGLSGIRLAVFILAPAALPAILAGLKIGWAFAWRTLIAAELVFGASSRSGGLGWFVFEHRNNLEIPEVFAGLLTVIAIGLLVEGLLFHALESRTVRRWGLQR
ncbi:ABC transporter permease subunit [Rhodovastum atsumiense]|uniref:ABC transporter permease subunit n=1 Tax=Rhodovastum atsumiense TaxID=504468 RepID=A0A5M6IT92_9PROT|nr:ABC transporter permease subunit [Rhodovastum atsumiense]KAA5611482.1 ABC transporter permease subunit [Rhodovastum atsumiense]CAH2601174.1 ABC transporter permease subunit [Rhodovastum atsumiense]